MSAVPPEQEPQDALVTHDEKAVVQGDTKERAKRLVKFYLDVIESGEKPKVKEISDAWLAYGSTDDTKDRQYANLFRQQIDTQLAYLDEMLGSVNVRPAEGFESNPIIKARAQVGERAIRYAFEELSFDRLCSRVLLSGLVAGTGLAVDRWDEGRTLPSFRSIKAQQIRWDNRAEGDVTRACWMAWHEWIHPDVLFADSEGRLDLPKLRQAAGNPTTRRKMLDAPEEEPREDPLGACCLVWHYFGRQQGAWYDEPPAQGVEAERGQPNFGRYDTGQEARRYLMLVDGYDAPLVDESEWPEEFALDQDDWPCRRLSFNDDLNHLHGTSDWRFVQKADDAYEDLLNDIFKSIKKALVTKYLKRKGAGASDETVNNFLNDPKAAVLEGLVDESGNPLLVAVDVAEFKAELVNALEVFREVADTTSMVNEILRGGGEDTIKGATAEGVRAVTEAATSKVRRRRQRFEAFQAELGKRWLEMAYKTVPRFSVLNVLNMADSANPTFVPQNNVPWEEVPAILARNPGSEIAQIGMDAIVGSDLAGAWEEGLPLEVIRRNLRIYVERGSTTQETRLRDAAALRDILSGLAAPLFAQLGRPDLYADFVKAVMGKMGMGEFDHLIPGAAEIQQAQASAAAAAPPPAATGGSPNAAV